jgi:predicted nucleic acid-binding protein
MAYVILADSSVWIDLFNGAQNAPVGWLREALEDGESDIITGDLITQEVLQGFRHDAHFAQAERALAVFPCATLGGRANCVAAAKMYRRLRQLGITIRKPVDVLIAAFCVGEKVTLLHNDRDFKPLVKHCGLLEIDA